MIESHDTDQTITIPTSFTIKLLDGRSKQLQSRDVEVKSSSISSSTKTDQSGIVKVQKPASGSMKMKLMPPSDGIPCKRLEYVAETDIVVRIPTPRIEKIEIRRQHA